MLDKIRGIRWRDGGIRWRDGGIRWRDGGIRNLNLWQELNFFIF